MIQAVNFAEHWEKTSKLVVEFLTHILSDDTTSYIMSSSASFKTGAMNGMKSYGYRLGSNKKLCAKTETTLRTNKRRSFRKSMLLYLLRIYRAS